MEHFGNFSRAPSLLSEHKRHAIIGTRRCQRLRQSVAKLDYLGRVRWRADR
jgi:hypothetical protein